MYLLSKYRASFIQRGIYSGEEGAGNHDSMHDGQERISGVWSYST